MTHGAKLRVCIFCGWHGKLTREDAWPSWLMRELFPHGVPIRKTFGTNLQQLAAHAKVAADLRTKIEAVCYPCNHDWLGPKEAEIKSKLLTWMAGLHGPLGVDDQRQLAFWTIKTTMTVQLAYPASERGVPRNQYRLLHANTDRPPTGVHVFVGHQPERVPGNLFAIQPIDFTHPELTPLGLRMNPYRAYQATLVIKRLVLKVIGHNGPPSVQLRRIFPNLDAIRDLTEIWPPSSLFVR